MKTTSTRRILVIAATATLSAALLGGVALAGFASPAGIDRVVAAMPGPMQAVATHLGIGRGPHGDLLGAALTYIGITRDQYMAGIQAGKSLAQLATENGKTRDGLIAAMTAAGNAAIDAARAELPTKAAELADSTSLGAKGRGFSFAGRGYHGPGASLSTAATYLGIGEADLRTKLAAGQTLGAIANATAGKSRDGLITAIADAMKAEIAQAQQAGRITADQATQLTAQVTAKATALVDATHQSILPGGPAGLRGPGFGPGGFGRRGR